MSRKRKQTVDEFAAGEAAQRLVTIRQKLRQSLLRGEHSIDDLMRNWSLTKAQANAFLDEFRDAGANLVEHAGKFTIDRYMAPDSETAWKVVGKPGKPYRFGLIADTHLGSKHCRLDVCEDLYDWFAKEGIGTVYHAGNWIEGEARFNKHELVPEAHGMQAQLDYFVEHYPQRDGIETLYVAGDDHEGWYSQREGVDIGRMLHDTARRAGRRDLTYLGYKEAFITLEHPKTKKHARLLIDHPGGGSSYAHSYAPQKRIEAAQGGEKPAIWCFGHWHKSGYFVNRNVHAILVPCTKDLDTFGRKKGLEYVIGGVIVEAWQDDGGAITQVTPTFKLYFDRGYSNQQYNLSGPVAKRATR
jgi:hypothetical protein